jgi:integrase
MKGEPEYCLHKASGRATVLINGKRCYLKGAYGSAESRLHYLQVIGELLKSEPTPVIQPTEHSSTPTISDLLILYYDYIDKYYLKNGKLSGQVNIIKLACKVLDDCFGTTQAERFGPFQLRACREKFQERLCRKECNRRVVLIKQFFKWLCENQLIPSTIYHGLVCVTGLMPGQGNTFDHEPKTPISHENIDAILPYVSKEVRVMIEIQRTTGMRPDEVVRMTKGSLNRASDPWEYTLKHHKTARYGKSRKIYLNKGLQELITPFLLRSADDPLFSPAEAKGGYQRRPRKRNRAEAYTTITYRQAIHRACNRAGIERWSPNRLRHTALTDIRRKYGAEAARAVAGHTTVKMTDNYTSEQDCETAKEIMRQFRTA